jgi:pimeloyl-ACP methyl ester carboxylesterase
MVTADQPTTLANGMRGAERAVMPGTGHFAVYEQPEEFNRIVLDFLAAEPALSILTRCLSCS